MATPLRSNSRLSTAMERTGQWVFSQEIPTDVIVEVGEANFNLHKFMLVAKSNYIRKLIMETNEADLTRINLSEIPGGPEIFEKAAKFCYGVNFEITVHNVAALRCAAEYLQMTDKYCDNNLAGRTEDFLSQVALSSLSGAVVVLKSCEDLLPMAEELKIVQRCIDVASARACNEASFPCRTPPNWWTEELSILDVELFGRIIGAMKQRGAKPLTIATALITYAERWLRDLVRDHSGNGIKCSEPIDSDLRIQQRELLESIVQLLPAEKAAFPIHFLCCLLRCAIFLKASSACRNEVEKRISLILEHVTVDDLLVLSFTYDGERLFDLDSVRRIISGFVEKEKSMASHPNLDEIEREKVCSSMDPLKLSYEARVHASQNKRLPVQIVLHALYYDQLKLRSGGADDRNQPDAVTTRNQLQADVSLVKENEALRTELLKMKMYISDMQKNNQTGTSSKSIGTRKPTFFSSMSKTLGKLNPFRHGSKDTSHIDDNLGVDVTKPRRRRFSIS
ncbi:Root phototropism 2 -like protein [Gossypium arboreum]|uniref:Root phototropism 2-like protein n=1 Tax=Gossypium arboreum TaxID=29729 RepID=A0A0B0N5M9_GOSAR|nr:Root phototropism 2 -like protein [Gossypium arboreum]